MRVTADALGAWVVKCNPAVTDFGSMLRSGEAINTWCVADNYRTALMDAGHRVALWVSGPSGARFPRGIWGMGKVRAPALPKPFEVRTGPARRRIPLIAQVDIRLWTTPITASEIASVAALSGIEVIRQPFMSNPSWLSKDEMVALEELIQGCEALPGHTSVAAKHHGIIDGSRTPSRVASRNASNAALDSKSLSK